MITTSEFAEKYGEEILKCPQCGFCQGDCPVFGITLRPAYNARGRILLLKRLLDGSIQPSRELAEAFYTCTNCKACTVSCPGMVRVDEIVNEFRKILYDSGFAPTQVLGIRDNISKTGNVFASKMEDRTEIYPRTPKATLLKEEPRPKAETLLFFGCVPSYLDMKIVPSLFTLAEAADLDFTTLGMDEICCGLPLMLMGSEEFESHAKMMVNRIKATEARELITPCAGCYKTFKEHYQYLGGLDLNVYHTVEYLEILINEGAIRLDRKIDKRVTYHDPCDLGRTFKIFEQPRNIIKKIPEIKFVEMSKNRDEARCCGGGGGVQAYNPDLSVSMATQRVRDALAVGAEIIVSGCAACKDNLKKGTRALPKEERGKLKVMDITEIVAKAMG